MKIQVLGSGCPTCKKLYETTARIATELNLSGKVDYITDITKLIELGVMQSPVLAVDGKPVLTGGGHSDADIRNALAGLGKKDDTASGGCQACGCHC